MFLKESAIFFGLTTKTKERVFIATFGNTDAKTATVDNVQLFMKSKNNQENILINICNICLPLADQKVSYAKKSYARLQGLDLTDTGEGECVDGVRFLLVNLTGKVLRGDGSGPVALESKMYWILTGLVKGQGEDGKQCVNFVNNDSTHVVFIESVSEGASGDKEGLCKFWDLKTLGVVENENIQIKNLLRTLK